MKTIHPALISQHRPQMYISFVHNALSSVDEVMNDTPLFLGNVHCLLVVSNIPIFNHKGHMNSDKYKETDNGHFILHIYIDPHNHVFQCWIRTLDNMMYATVLVASYRLACIVHFIDSWFPKCVVFKCHLQVTILNKECLQYLIHANFICLLLQHS